MVTLGTLRQRHQRVTQGLQSVQVISSQCRTGQERWIQDCSESCSCSPSRSGRRQDVADTGLEQNGA